MFGNLIPISDLIVLAVAIGAATMTLSKGSIFEKCREKIGRASWILDRLINCPFCLSHEISFITLVWYASIDKPISWYLLHMFALVALANVTILAIGYSFLVIDALDGDEE